MTGRPANGRGRLVAAGAVVAGLAVVYGAGFVSHPATIGSSTELAQPTGVPVVSAVRACPAPGSAGVTAASVATAARPATSGPGTGRPAVSGQAASGPAGVPAGSVVISRLSGTGSPATGRVVRKLARPGMLGWSPVRTAPPPKVTRTRATGTGGTGSTGTGKAGKKGSGTGGTGAGGTAGVTGPDVATSPGRGGVLVQAAGAMAQGLEVEQTGPGGLVTGQCAAPGTDFWFAGPGTDTASHIQLYLMNPDGDPADVEVDGLTDNGPLVGSSDTGIVVPPHGMVTQSLGKLLHNSRVIGLHVSTSVGRVVAGVRETKSTAEPGGWLTPLQPPARRLVIPGLPKSAGTRELFIVVPGSDSAQLKVTAVTAKGSYQPTGGNGIDLAGDSVVSVKLPSLSDVAAAVKITSSVPVAAAIEVPGGANGAPGAFSGTATPVREQGIAAANPAGTAGSADLVISAPKTAASVRIATATTKVAFDQGRVVHVAAGHTVVTRIKPPKGGKTDTFAALVTPLPGSGPVYVGRFIASGGLIRTILPVTSALTWVPLASARDSLDAVRPGR
ncbi:MAG TPA: DUF5719 family protein [Streptosporangiaceae bacterium]|nr:DUF5719 family protein [Streptosporangiaceae bacterium]